MRERLEMLLDELRYLKREGINEVYCEEDSINRLKEVVKNATKHHHQPTPNPSISKITVPENTVKPTSSPKKLNPFSPLPTENLQKKPIVEIKIKPEAISTEMISINLPKGDKQTQWNYLHEKILNCPSLRKDSKPNSKAIFGTGNLDADIFFCGDYPGKEEENEKTPFGGEANLLINKILNAMGLHREAIYIANILSWPLQPTTDFNERTPTEEELNINRPYLKAQIEIVNPKVIVALGATSVNGLLGLDKTRKMSDIRGQWLEFMQKPLMITFHPSYLIRNNTIRTKRLFWEDMLSIMTYLNMPISEKQQGFFKG